MPKVAPYQKNRLNSAGFLMSLADLDADARNGLAGEMGLFSFDKSDNPVFRGVNGEVPRNVSPGAGDFGAAGLANEDLAALYFLATKTLDAETLASVVVDVLGGTASFNM